MTTADRDEASVPNPIARDEGSPPKSGGFGDLGPRVGSAVVLAILAVTTLIAGGHVFVLFWLVAAFAINWEWQGLIGGERRLARVVIGAVALSAAAGFTQGRDPIPGLVVLVALSGVVAVLAGPSRRLWAIAGVIYAGALIVSVCALRDSPGVGLLAIAWLFALVWGADVFAYFGGRAIGGPKLWPRVSAGKTWSGTITGLLSGALLGLAVAHFGADGAIKSLPLFLMSFAAAALAQIGDLAESAVKRRFGVKDSSQLIPGHGGVMDRLDGFILASLFAASVGAFRGLSSTAAGVFFW
ncbi:MAG: phosphatidate cytidylyltransferase [Methylocystis sp.]